MRRIGSLININPSVQYEVKEGSNENETKEKEKNIAY